MEREKFENLPDEETVINAVKGKRDFLYGLKNQRLQIHEKINDIADELETKYPNARRTYLFHILIHSGIDRNQCVDFDFPGKDSIVKRLESLVQEYQAKAE